VRVSGVPDRDRGDGSGAAAIGEIAVILPMGGVVPEGADEAGRGDSAVERDVPAVGELPAALLIFISSLLPNKPIIPNKLL